MTADRTVIVLTLSFGFCAVLFLQAVGTVVAQAIWWTVKR